MGAQDEYLKARLEQLGIDTQAGLQRFAGKAKLYHKNLRRFSEETLAQGMRKPENTSAFASYIHALKGVTANLSLLRVNELIQKFEMTIRAGEPDLALYERTCATLAETLTGILEVVPKEEAAGTGLPIGSEEELFSLLRHLQESLQAANSAKCEDIVAKLRQKEWQGARKILIQELGKAIEEYDYDTALQRVKSVR